MKNKSKRSLNIESLEGRLACAGNVTAVLNGTELVITGKAEPNAIQVMQNSSNEITVQGRAFNGLFSSPGVPTLTGKATTINGTNTVKTFSGVQKITIRLNGGNDAVFIGGDSFNTQVRGLLVDTGAGSDFVSIRNTQFNGAGQLTVKTQRATGAAGLNEAGNDYVLLDSISGNAQTKVVMTTGGGNDTIMARSVYFENTVSVFTGGGADRVTVRDSFLGATKLNTGTSAHRDVVAVFNSSIQSVDAVFGAGNDELTFNNSSVMGLAKLNGGVGKDTLAVSSNSSIGTANVISFNP